MTSYNDLGADGLVGLDGHRKVDPHVLVIFGASGDLAQRKILPALAQLADHGSLPEAFTVVGIARRPLGDDGFRTLAIESGSGKHGGGWERLVEHFRYIAGDYTHPDTFSQLADLLEEIDATQGTCGNRIYYFATVPSIFGTVADGLGSHGLNLPAGDGTFARLVVEKPFGSDLESALELHEALHRNFAEEQIFRIDHYLGKETVLNLLALRFANSIFEPIWNRSYVDHVQIAVAESLGVEHRGAFYESAGALRDVVQNHVMQVLALTLMEPPGSMDANGIRDEKIKLLRSMIICPVEEQRANVVRGQYVKGRIDHVDVLGYREDEGVAPDSETETYVAMRLGVDNWRWAGVPIFIRTGKRLPKRATEISIVFQRPPHLPFAGRLSRDLRPDTLTIRIQPDEGISLAFGAKVPGPAFRVRTVEMDFSYAESFVGPPADAYERLILDVMVGDPMLFIRADEVDQAWRIVEPVLQSFAKGEPPLAFYAAGTWGPNSADWLIEEHGHEWLNP
ncbi:MAG TPA: glucose-6-phosphate dehydrogenase [Acidimicrobiales bacterium]|nr:glucose-6-phosphate dehydrogenase [Acidimicrobiales bacterium]